MPKSEAEVIGSVEHFVEAPVIYFDAVPTITISGPVISMTLAAKKIEMIKGSRRSHIVAVVDLRMTAETGRELVAMIEKVLLAAHPTAGPAN
jgi:hypothetical protein